MASGDIRFNVGSAPDLADVAALLAQIPEELKDLRKAWRRAAKEVIVPSMKDAFRGKHTPTGESWAAADPLYALLKKRQHGKGARRLLRLDGALQKAMARIGKSPGAIRTYEKNFMRFGTNLDHAPSMQWGFVPGGFGRGKRGPPTSPRSKRGKAEQAAARSKGTPRRGFAELTGDAEDAIARIVAEKAQEIIDNKARALAARRARGF